MHTEIAPHHSTDNYAYSYAAAQAFALGFTTDPTATFPWMFRLDTETPREHRARVTDALTRQLGPKYGRAYREQTTRGEIEFMTRPHGQWHHPNTLLVQSTFRHRRSI